MKIAFVNPPWWTVENNTLRRGIRAGSRWPFTLNSAFMPDNFTFGQYTPFPHFLAHAASYTKMLLPDAEFVVRDSIARGESYMAFESWIRDEKPEWAVLETASASIEHDLRLIHYYADIKWILCGPIDKAQHNEIIQTTPNVRGIVQGEYDKAIVNVLKTETRTGYRAIIPHDLLTREEMSSPPFPMWDEECATNYWDACPTGQIAPQLQMWTSRGCPYKCLTGDTLVNTVLGNIPIRELEGKEGIGVFTYDPVERRGKVCSAKNIRKYGTADKVVRVHFDDGSHIDCTPDHKFLAFKWGNQFTGEKEWRCEAKDLQPGTHVRALKFCQSGKYIEANWARRGRDKVNRMVLEWKLGRRLTGSEIAHHKDRNKCNNQPDNLELKADPKDHFAAHPEISLRIRLNNPTKNGLSEEWKEKVRKASLGKVRSPESRERYRQAAIKREAAKRARGIDGRFEPVDIVNHRVVRVEELPGLHETYCLEVPETGWFYANNVLVKNCCFCVFPATMTGNDPDGTKPRAVRFHSPQWVENYIWDRVAKHGFKSIYFDDDTFNLNNNHTLAICNVMKKIALPWSAMCRADTIPQDTWKVMKESGCFGVKLGFESGSQYVIDHIVNKKLDLQKAFETAVWLQQDVGIKVHGTFTVGLPGETADQAIETHRFIERLYSAGGMSTHQLSGTATIEGTPLSRIAKGEHLEKYDGATSEGFVVSADGQRKVEQMVH